MKYRFVCAGFLAVAMSFGAVGCGDTVDEISNKIDCHSVCERYSECFDPDYDVEGCEDKCENNADSSEAREAKLERCDDCMDDRSCAGTAFNCADDCLGIVP